MGFCEFHLASQAVANTRGAQGLEPVREVGGLVVLPDFRRQAERERDREKVRVSSNACVLQHEVPMVRLLLAEERFAGPTWELREDVTALTPTS